MPRLEQRHAAVAADEAGAASDQQMGHGGQGKRACLQGTDSR